MSDKFRHGRAGTRKFLEKHGRFSRQPERWGRDRDRRDERRDYCGEEEEHGCWDDSEG